MRIRRLASVVIAVAALSSCSSNDANSSDTADTTSSSVDASAPTVAAPAMTLAPDNHKWVDLEVGDCIAEVPAVDLGAVTVSLVDCATPHAAEVYLRAPVAVDAAITGVADRACAGGVKPYTGGGADFSVTYLIDSSQDRTGATPLPSTVICLLQSSNGAPLTGSARG